MKKISIVTISFNQREYLEQCIKSVATQTGDWEHIIVDPGSTDGSRELIESYSNHFTEIIFEPDDGPADGLNRGFARATGDIGYFLNSDDFLLPDAVSKMHDLWNRGGDEIDLLLCGAWKIDAQGLPTTPLIPTAPDERSFANGLVAVVQQGMSFRMSMFTAVQGFNPSNRTCWDGELLASFIAKGARYRISNKRIAAFRIHGESISGGAGGAALARRYADDSVRIRKQYFAPFVNTGLGAFARLHRLVNYLGHPRRTLLLVFSRAFPAAVRKKWISESGSV